MGKEKKRAKAHYPEHYMFTPKDEIEVCLNCSFAECVPNSDYCPLRMVKAKERFKAREEDVRK